MNLQLSEINIFKGELTSLPEKKLMINTINAHCYNIAQKDKLYAEALFSSDVLLPDGVSIVLAVHLLNRKRLKKIAGADLFFYEMARLNKKGGRSFFLGSSQETLKRITNQAKKKYPNVTVGGYSPPYSEQFSEKENKEMISAINNFKPDVLFIGMTAPKQEKWAFTHFSQLEAGHICSIGAVFDFFAGNIKRAPDWMINIGLEWLYRLLKEPRRLWRRYILGNSLFIRSITIEFINNYKMSPAQ